MKTDDSYKKTFGVTIRVDEPTFNLLNDLAKKDRRTVSDVTRLLLERGVELFHADGILIPADARPTKKKMGGSGAA